MTKIIISDRARKFGYIIWRKADDQIMDNLLLNKNEVDLYFNGSFLGKKNIDRKHRRISIGYKWTRMIPSSHTQFIASLERGKELKVITK